MLTDNNKAISKCLLRRPNFIYDEACLDFNTNTNLTLFAQYSECVDCVLKKWPMSKSYLVNTKYPINFHILFHDNTWCNKTYWFFERSRYNWNICEWNRCPDVCMKEYGINSYIPILLVISLILGLYIFGLLTKYLYKCTFKEFPNILNYFRRNDRLNNNINEEPLHTDTNLRLISIDAFRGFCILCMILINYGGGQYTFLKYSTWDGLKLGDLCITWFLWLMGFCIPISIHKRVQNETPWQKTVFDIIYRSIVLVILGLVVNFYGNGSSIYGMRIPGYLQRLGILYFIVGILEMIFLKHSYQNKNFLVYDNKYCFFRDLLTAWPQWVFVLMIVSVHTWITMFLPVPGCPEGYLGPGGLQNYPTFKNCTGGAAGYIDLIVFGKYHLDNSSYAHEIYEIGQPFDSAGILGHLTGILLVYLGVQAGRIYIVYSNKEDKVYRWLFIWTTIPGVLGLILCSSNLIPLNSSLLSLSLVLIASSSATLILCGLHIITDIFQSYSGKPFIYPGANSILLYVGHKVFQNAFPFSWKVHPIHFEYLTMHVWATFLWLLISIYLYNKKIPLKI